MQEEKEKNIDIKGTLQMFVKTDEPELEQEEAIMKYNEAKKRRLSSSTSDDGVDGNSEEQEHLRRVKKELIESLKRVELLESEIFKKGLLDEKSARNHLKVNGGGKNSSIKTIDEHVIQENQKERE